MHYPGYASPSPASPTANSSPEAFIAAADAGRPSKFVLYEDRQNTGSKRELTSIQMFFVLASVFSLVMLIMTPVWNCIVLIDSNIYSFMLGRQLPITIVSCLGAIILAYLATIVGFFRLSRREVQTPQSLVMIGGATLTLLGVAFMLLGHALSDSAREAAKEVDLNCRSGPTTSKLYREADLLYVLRFQPSCATMASVEMCDGYRQTENAMLLKSLELELRCSTFCGDPMASIGEANKGLPRTLFSEANFQASCETVLVRNLRNYVEDMGEQTYYQGCMLVIVAIIINALQLLGMCTPARTPKPLGPGYQGVYGTL